MGVGGEKVTARTGVSNPNLSIPSPLGHAAPFRVSSALYVTVTFKSFFFFILTPFVSTSLFVYCTHVFAELTQMSPDDPIGQGAELD